MADLTTSADLPGGVSVTGPTVEGDTAFLRVTGELDLSCLREVEAAVDAAVAQAPARLVVDLSGLRFMDSSGLAVLLGAARRVRAFEIRDPSTPVRRLITLSGLTATLPMTP